MGGTSIHKGRIRPVVRPEERQARALEMRLRGATFQAIAECLGYASRMGAYKAVAAGMQKSFCEPAQELRTLELERLDRLHEALWPRALGGDNAALDRVLKVMDSRARLLGLYAPARVQADVRKAYDVANSPDLL